MIVFFVLFNFGCVSKKKLTLQQEMNKKLSDSLLSIQSRLKICQNDLDARNKEVNAKNNQIDVANMKAQILTEQLKNLSIINSSQAGKLSEELSKLNRQEFIVNNIQNEIARRDSVNIHLVRAISSSLPKKNNVNLNISVQGSAVYVDLIEPILFSTGGYKLNKKNKEIILSISKVINNFPEIQVMVEGHTDNKPIWNSNFKDNWDLSVKRATEVVRILKNEGNVNPSKITAAGRSQFSPQFSNDSKESMAKNRRIRILLMPSIDQFVSVINSSIR